MDLSKFYPPRNEWSHKGNFGSVLVVAGSKLYSGAATFSAVGALRAGADLVTVCAPQRAADISANKQIDLMTFPLKGDRLAPKHVHKIVEVARERKVNSLVIGPGLSRGKPTLSAILKLISKFNMPMVVDADGLRAISQKPSVVSSKQMVLTPHLGELAILLGVGRIKEDFDSRLAACRDAASKYQAVVLLKGHVDIICDGVNVITNNTGSVYMTKGGFGDVLAGIVGALLARGVGLFEAAAAGAYINGRAGEMACEAKGEGVVASDIFDYIPDVIAS